VNAIMPNPLPCIPGPRGMRGVGLIEVLVAVAILAFGLLGIAAMQATAIRNSQSSYERSQAVTLSYSMLDRMRANPNVVHATPSGYNTTLMCKSDDVPDDGGAQAKNDLDAWLAELHDRMGSSACGRIEITFDATTATYEAKITVQWDDSRGTNGNSAQTLTTSTAI
jgi:type IV pilus assembly protein PilV